MFSTMISFQAMFSCLMICLSGYALIRARTSEDSIRFFFFFLGMLYEVFFPCYAGNEVVEKSEELLFNLYSSNWPELDTHSKKMLLTFSIRLNDPIIIKFGFIKRLRLRTFTEVVDISYKIYAVLQRTQK
ncbi:odorant receptor 94b-like [Hermetia illucens]|uniref:odorant receptor 94b-like n=1 Tax=Hermetia illucens TaxID=343691 RepID=UPI0018CC169C|nr:odorant receptor 94b-like [Hermetia illucens]